ncbi:hypothetical protein [Paenibacillus hexagrammi]|uniref:Uncharacterized protein n=1 Tax=Paenibacillus hexagrammi TaxID=2908839 RepID=A0ABY3SNC3_9BACL|nr:hypothetical protein [Paenibacillus sp. YPD9-1]UJF34630.1 hypothetical protein L0M14_05490 [Paenibacillus sp. YPD9-1]
MAIQGAFDFGNGATAPFYSINFYFIAGYTDGGFPYGITWEEHETQQELENRINKDVGELRMSDLKLTEHQWKEFVETYDMYMDGIESFLNAETGELVTLRTYDMDDEDEELSEIIDEGFNEIYFREVEIGK